MMSQSKFQSQKEKGRHECESEETTNNKVLLILKFSYSKC